MKLVFQLNSNALLPTYVTYYVVVMPSVQPLGGALYFELVFNFISRCCISISNSVCSYCNYLSLCYNVLV